MCLPPAEVKALVKWKRDVDLIQSATVRCSLIEWVDE